MSTVSILAIAAAGMIVVGFIWAWLALKLIDGRAGSGAAASMVALPGIALLGLGICLAVFNGIVAVSI